MNEKVIHQAITAYIEQNPGELNRLRARVLAKRIVDALKKDRDQSMSVQRGNLADLEDGVFAPCSK